MDYVQIITSVATLVGYYLVTKGSVRGHQVSFVASVSMVIQFVDKGMWGFAMLNVAFALIAANAILKSINRANWLSTLMNGGQAKV